MSIEQQLDVAPEAQRPTPADAEAALVSTVARLRRVPSQQRSREKVEKILAAANAMVVESGVDGVNTRSIAQRSGVPVASLYQYFDDVEAILLALVDRDMQRMDERVIVDLMSMETWTAETFVSTAIDAFVAIHLSSKSFVEIYLRGRGTRVIDAYGHLHNRQVAEMLRDLVVSAGLVTDDLTARAAELMLEVGDRALQMAFENDYTPDMDIVTEGKRMLVSYLEHYLTDEGRTGVPVPR